MVGHTDHNLAEVKVAKGWVYRAPPRTPRKLRKPNWAVLREAAQVARSALAVEMDMRFGQEQPTTWSEVVSLGLGVSWAVLGEGRRLDPTPWVRGCEPELSSFEEVSRASLRKRKAEDWDEWKASVADVRRCKRRRSAWFKSKEVAWWEKADQGDAFWCFCHFKELRNRGASSLSLGKVRPADAPFERDAWAEHY